MPSSGGTGRPRSVIALRVAAWLLLAGIVFATLAPIGLRPMTDAPPNFERAIAYALFGAAFALAYPRRLGLAILIIVVAAIGLELLQMLATTRHARLADAAVKLMGGGLGVAAGLAIAHVLRAQRRRQV
jgi:VanZ family protein